MKRIQIHIQDETYEKLKEIKWVYHTSVANLIRVSIDIFLAFHPLFVKKLKEEKNENN